MTPTRPYFVQAMFDWILDNELTPFLSVYSDYPTTVVPLEYAEDGQITLNIAPSAVHNFYLDKEAISFQARFSGVSMQVYVPMGAIMGLYAKENGHGMAFPEEPYYIELAESLEQEQLEGEAPAAKLGLVEAVADRALDEAEEGLNMDQEETSEEGEITESVNASKAESDKVSSSAEVSSKKPKEDNGKKPKGSHLKVIK